MGAQRRGVVWRVLGAASIAVTLGAAAADIGPDGTITLNSEERAACAREGGCVLLTRAIVLRLLALAERGERLKCDAKWKWGPI